MLRYRNAFGRLYEALCGASLLNGASCAMQRGMSLGMSTHAREVPPRFLVTGAGGQIGAELIPFIQTQLVPVR